MYENLCVAATVVEAVIELNTLLHATQIFDNHKMVPKIWEDLQETLSLLPFPPSSSPFPLGSFSQSRHVWKAPIHNRDIKEFEHSHQ